MHTLLAAPRLIQRAIHKFGPARGFVVLSRYTMPSAFVLCAMCICAGGYDLARGRRVDALLWLLIMALSFIAFWLKTTYAGNPLSAAFAIAAVAIDLWVLTRSIRGRLNRES